MTKIVSVTWNASKGVEWEGAQIHPHTSRIRNSSQNAVLFHVRQARGVSDGSNSILLVGDKLFNTTLDSGKILTWTKGFSAKHAIGNDVVKRLQDAFDSKHIHVKCVALVNNVLSGPLLFAGIYCGQVSALRDLWHRPTATYVEDLSNLRKLANNPAASRCGIMVVNTRVWHIQQHAYRPESTSTRIRSTCSALELSEKPATLAVLPPALRDCRSGAGYGPGNEEKGKRRGTKRCLDGKLGKYAEICGNTRRSWRKMTEICGNLLYLSRQTDLHVEMQRLEQGNESKVKVYSNLNEIVCRWELNVSRNK
ncbi:hypothetical protein B0H14DRAFT_2592727 [Mycena olivaceomarginata]|nr:hypothetical protein B0H14DRAFT_2592727 [Mycena olivaceomarginata]